MVESNEEMLKVIDTLMCPSFNLLYQGDRDKFIYTNFPLYGSGQRYETGNSGEVSKILPSFWSQYVDANSLILEDSNSIKIDPHPAYSRLFQISFSAMDICMPTKKHYYLNVAKDLKAMKSKLLLHIQSKTFGVDKLCVRFVYIPLKASKKLLDTMIRTYQDELPYNNVIVDDSLGSGGSSIRRKSMTRSSISSLTTSEIDLSSYIGETGNLLDCNDDKSNKNVEDLKEDPFIIFQRLKSCQNTDNDSSVTDSSDCDQESDEESDQEDEDLGVVKEDLKSTLNPKKKSNKHCCSLC